MRDLLRSFLFALTIASIAASAQVLDPNAMNLRAQASIGSKAMIGTADSNARSLSGLERETLQLINQERIRAGLGTLVWNDKIAAVARSHSNNMAEYNFFSHKGLDGTLVDDRARILQMGPWQAIGENIAFLKGFDDPVTVAVEKWLRSAGHRGNMLDPRWTETAVGLAVSPDGKYYFTQVFIRN